MKKITITLTAGESIQVAVVGNYFRALTAIDPFKVTFSDGTSTEFLAGLGMRVPAEFSTIRIESDTAQDVTFIAGIGQVDDSRLAGQIDITGGMDTQEQGAASSNYGAVSVGVAATLIHAANTARKSILIQPQDGDIFVGSDNLVTTANGVKVASGVGFVIYAVNDVYAIAASAVDTRYLEEVN